IVAATNRGLLELVNRRLFREDLFYRLGGVEVRVPTLRERRSDVLELAEYFLRRHRGERPVSISPLAADALVNYDWPGNVRELERLMERAIALADTEVLDLDDLPPTIRGDFSAAVVPSLRRNDTLRAWSSRYARWCSIGARATSAKPAACSTSPTTRCRPICASATTRAPASPRRLPRRRRRKPRPRRKRWFERSPSLRV